MRKEERNESAERVEILRLRALGSDDEAAAESLEDWVANERPVDIEVNGRVIAVVMALPGKEEELAAGFLLGEGIINRREDLLLLRTCEPENPPTEAALSIRPVRVSVVIPVEKQPEESAPLVVRYACGAVGEGFSAPAREPLPLGLQVRSERLREMLAGLTAGQEVFRVTGGTHAAGLFEASGERVISKEDIGRHNAVDRVLGRGLLEGIELSDKVLITTGRASADLVSKALTARVPILASLSAPTALAVDLARKGGLTLIGFLRPRRFNIYAWQERILK
jgi:FdhD protein